MAQLVIHRRAARYFERLDERRKSQLREKLAALARDPSSMPGVKPMAGEWRGFYRLRHGDLRVIYLYDAPGDRVVVAHIGPRGDVYK